MIRGGDILSGKKRIILTPSYMKGFNCIGSLCEDSCCIGWRVVLDKHTYLKYKKIQDKELKPIFQKMINRERGIKNNEAYGKIKMEKNGRCPFLDEKNLCKIYQKLGEEYLSDTCTFYPRIVNIIDGKFERSASVSCLEITRIALLNPNGIVFEQIEENLEIPIKINGIVDIKGYEYLNKIERYFWDIRMFSLSLLQNRKYMLSERLMILGIVYKKIQLLHLNNNIKDIPLMLADMVKLIENGSFKEELGKVPTNTQLQMSIAKWMIDVNVLLGITNERYKECTSETLVGLGFIEGVEIEDIEDIVENYETNYSKYLSEYFKEKEYILENYLVNEYFKELMPFGNYKSIWDSYIFLCVIYSMIKLHIIGMAGYHKGFNDDLTLKLIQCFSKVILHNNEYIQYIIKLLKDHEYDSLAYMSILVKN